MSPLSKSLEKRIQQLTASIEAQRTELAAYERVLHMEVSKGSTPVETSSADEEHMAASHYPKTRGKKRAGKKSAGKKMANGAAAIHPRSNGAAELPSASFAGNKTSLVAEIVRTHGSAGATPKDVDAYFTERNIEKSKNLIYNTLSYLVARKKLKRRNGKYFSTGRSGAAKKAAGAAKTPTKRRLSPEGLKRIKEALKKRWAMKKAAEAAEGKSATKK